MHQMLWKFNTRAHAGVWNFAVSAIDVALWDIKGKFFKTPIWRLLGGAQKSLPAYITFGLRAYSTRRAGRSGKILGWKGREPPENSGGPAQYSRRDGSIRRGGGAPRG